ncbi:hypothetical protein [Zymobacter sp. IVIA_12111.31 C1]|uniref:hypothetical protein n=1 Tax=Zymobacter sp. IVIA_12111.31 C1 TaxID=3394854 RepID=UPI0039C48CB6
MKSRVSKENEDYKKINSLVDLKLRRSGSTAKVKVYDKENGQLLLTEQYKHLQFREKTLDDAFLKSYPNSKKGIFLKRLLNRIENKDFDITKQLESQKNDMLIKLDEFIKNHEKEKIFMEYKIKSIENELKKYTK